MEQDNKAVVRRLVEEFQSQGNVATAEELMSIDFINHTARPGAPNDRQGVIDLFSRFRAAFPDFRAEIHDQVAEDDLVVTRKTFYGTHKADYYGAPATNREVAILVIDIVRVVDGKLIEHWGLMDQFSLLQQIGAIPARQQAALTR